MNSKLNITLVACLLALVCMVSYAQNPVPAGKQVAPVLLVGGTVHTGTGTVIENGAVAFAEGKLTYVGPAATLPESVASYTKTDVTGKHVYPGLILLNTTLGLNEIGAIKATLDYNEIGAFNPNVRTVVAFNTDSELIPTVRSNGILLAQPTPTGGVVSGQSSVVHLDGWNWEDAAVKTDEGLHLNWPNKYSRPRWWMGETEVRLNEEYDKTVDVIRAALADGKAYAALSAPDTKNLKLEAMRGLYDGSKTAYFHTETAATIVQGIQLLQEYGVQKIVLVNAYEAFYVKDFLKENKIPVVIDNVHRKPERDDVPVDMPYQLPAVLKAAGLEVSLTYSEDMVGRTRSLPFLAGTAAAYGVGKEEALQMITLAPAKVLGIADKAGSLETGKDAYVVVASGDLLDMRTATVTHAFIQGRTVDLNNKHKVLYEKFKQKYEQQR